MLQEQIICPDCGGTRSLKCSCGHIWYWDCDNPTCPSHKHNFTYTASNNSGV